MSPVADRNSPRVGLRINPEVAAGTFDMAEKRPVSSGSKGGVSKENRNREHRAGLHRGASHESFICVPACRAVVGRRRRVIGAKLHYVNESKGY